MELKNYQKQVIADLERYMELLGQTQNIAESYKQLWEEKGVEIGTGAMPAYQNIIPAVPVLALKIPTGGGKTFLAACAIKSIFEKLPDSKAKVVVWLVPSDAILEQTVGSLKDPSHPYRQRINADFGGRVEVYTKQELLSGQNFNIASIAEQLSIMVLSYDSFRGKKDALKARQENSSLAPMAEALGKPEYPVENADETALIQIINQLTPVVIVDESHHARSQLSKKTLADFNPSFVLDLSATPTKESNLLSVVGAVQLKKENMVKLPVIVYNRDEQDEVISDAIDLRNKLEEYAKANQATDGNYIRPIVLFQAEPKIKDDATTYEKLRKRLADSGIPEDQIAIKTAQVNELKNIDLKSSECQIRYIITVNALKEGWDCSYAYILASLANKTSSIDVEQILGRILRQPNSRKNSISALNTSYVLTSSRDFQQVINSVVTGLNGAGFTDRDYRVAGVDQSSFHRPEQIHANDIVDENEVRSNSEEPQLAKGSETTSTAASETAYPDALESKDVEIHSEDEVIPWKKTEKTNGIAESWTSADKMIDLAQAESDAFEKNLHEHADDPQSNESEEIIEKKKLFYVNKAFEKQVEALRIPEFYVNKPSLPMFQMIGDEEHFVKLQQENLDEKFTLKGKPAEIDFSAANDQAAEIDISDESNRPKVFKMSENEQLYFQKIFSKKSPQEKVDYSKKQIHKILNKMDGVSSEELKVYIDRVVEDMDRETLSALVQAPQAFANKFKDYIKGLLIEHRKKQFDEWLDENKIECKPTYKLPKTISPLNSIDSLGKSLYEGEESVNGQEARFAMELTGMPNISWWHRNIARKEFCLNGYLNHYPDFIICTQKGNIILAETKGDDRNNEDSSLKLELGRDWESLTGPSFRYFMVFDKLDTKMKGAMTFAKFFSVLKSL